jgi:hypothetical protein
MAAKNNYKFLIAIIVILIIFLLYPKDYQKEYNVSNYHIVEKYYKLTNEYYFNISNDELNFDYYVNNKKILSKKLIENIETYSNDDITCVEPTIKGLRAIPLCKNLNSYIDYHLVSNDIKDNFKNINEYNYDLSQTIDNVNVYNLMNKKFLIWQYNKFKYIDVNGSKDIKLFDNDYYNINLAVKINNYLVIPNYDENYDFDEMKIINLDNLKVTSWKLHYTISYDSYIVGTYNKSIYLMDRKNKLEYELVPHVKKIRIVASSNSDGLIYDSGMKKINFNLLLQQEEHFNYGYNTNYLLSDDKMYYVTNNNKVLISNKNVNKIVYSNNEEVYYLVNGTLYYFNVFTGEVPVLDYFEWNFNNENVIFPY